MYSSAGVTNYAANFLFIGYMVVVALLFSQLLVGVIINLYTEVQNLNSQRLYIVFRELYRDFGIPERESIKRSLLMLNRR